MMEEKLLSEPNVETKNRKPLRQPALPDEIRSLWPEETPTLSL
jgi:hypothetical protein